ncbi:MAG: hypothetical protein RIR11_4169 [Bacteroidota bacterium]
MESYKIWTIQDIENIPTDTPVHLEIYLRNAVIPLQHINANCAVRAEGCKFPNLILVKGNLSIDAKAAKFPVLKTVEGDCDIHCLGIELPCLECVKGVLSIEANVPLYALKTVGNRLENKAKIRLPNLTEFGKKTWEIHTMSNVAQLPLDGKFNLEILGSNLTIPHTTIGGFVRIRGKNIAFPNLHTVKKIIVEKIEGQDSDEPILLPQLRTVSVNCVIRDGSFVAPQLEYIKNKLIVEGNGFAEFPLLKTVRSFSFSSKRRVYFPSLQKVFGNFHCYNMPPLLSSTTPNLSLEEQQEAHCFPRLNTIQGDAHINDNSDLPVLEAVNGTLTFASNKVFPTITRVGNLTMWKAKDIATFLPNIKSIYNTLYSESIGHTVSKIEHLFFQVAKTLFVSKDRFIIYNDWHGSHESGLWRCPIYPLHQLVSILKMRHTSFQNFITNEFEQEWLNPNELMDEILKSIEQKWHQVPTYSLQDIDKMSNYSLTNFSYSYVPIVEIMTTLKAKCISAKGFDVRSFRYDTLGNKIAFFQHHTYEIYEADGIYNLKYGNYMNSRYAIKCTYTYDEYEQWFWVEGRYKNDPLEAIASTIKMHENVIPFIKSIKRKGDTIVFEMKEEVMPLGNARPLTKREYFGLLEVEV